MILQKSKRSADCVRLGITRAMKDLTLTCAQQRMIRGETQYNKVSRFIKEIPRELVELGREFQEKKVMDIPMPTSFTDEAGILKQLAFVPKQFEVKKSDGLDYSVGDTVKHIKFGSRSSDSHCRRRAGL